jgi:hypothetical protein
MVAIARARTLLVARTEARRITLVPGGGRRRRFAFPSFVACLVFVVALGGDRLAHAAEGALLRIETEVFADDDKQPLARSLTLFRNGIAWDFLETLDKGEVTTDEPAEFVLHDPARERIVLVDPARHVRTQVDSLRLERLRSSLGAWARKSDDPVIRWAGGPDFAAAMEEESTTIVLNGPRVRYEVEFEQSKSAEIAEEYRRFADAALLVKALVHPGGLPPFPRIAINRRVAAAEGIPVAVRLEMDSRIAKLGGRPSVMRAEHKVLAGWLASDHKRVAAAEERMAVAAPVDLATYAGSESAVIATSQGDDSPARTVR